MVSGNSQKKDRSLRNRKIYSRSKDANIHAKEYQLYLPSKEELKRKLLDWASEIKFNAL